MASDNFFKFVLNFARDVRCSSQESFRLIVHNNESHLSIEVLEFAKENVVMTSHIYFPQVAATRSALVRPLKKVLGLQTLLRRTRSRLNRRNRKYKARNKECAKSHVARDLAEKVPHHGAASSQLFRRGELACLIYCEPFNNSHPAENGPSVQIVKTGRAKSAPQGIDFR